MKRTIFLVGTAVLTSFGISLEQSRLAALVEAWTGHYVIGDQLSTHDPADADDEGDEPKPPPLQASATFEGGLKGELNAEASLGPAPSDRLAS